VDNPLARARLQKGMSQAQVARLAGVSQAYVSHIELGRRTPRLPLALRLAAALGQPIEALWPDLATRHGDVG
jgi:putative transcriptional regulator